MSQKVRAFRLRRPFRKLCAVALNPGNAPLGPSNSLGFFGQFCAMLFDAK